MGAFRPGAILGGGRGRGIPVRFFQTVTPVLQLGKAKREGTLDRPLADIGKAVLMCNKNWSA